MSMNVLGAETGQLESLAAQLTRTGTEIEQVQTETQTTADTVVAEMEGTFHRALQGIAGSMQHLMTSVTTAHGQLSSTTWTGVNAATFETGYGEFGSAMESFEVAVQNAYSEFDIQMRSMGENITNFQTQVARSMQQAHMSTESMQQAVTQQQLNLESAMNTGLSFG